MTDDRKSGIALIAGSVGGIVTMAIHPTAGGPMTADQISRLAVVSAVAHSVAMVSTLVLFLGACGLGKRLASADRIAFAGLVTYAFACVAVLNATAVSGFIVPGVMQHMAHDVANQRIWQIVIDGIFQFNQAFARIFSVAASLAVILWSISSFRNGGLGRGVATYGCVIGPLIIVALGIGHLRLDVHGMAAIWLGQAIWFIIAGAQLCGKPANAVSQ